MAKAFPEQNTAGAAASADGQRPLARSDLPWLLAGALLMAAFVLQAGLQMRWEWLASLQENETYKQVTGLALALCFAMQWRLSLARMQSDYRPGPRMLAVHRDRGALAPVLLYLHAVGLGHAYIRVMSVAFLLLVALGLLQRPIARMNRPWLAAGWLVVHVALAAMLVFLIGYHAFNAFYYE